MRGITASVIMLLWLGFLCGLTITVEDYGFENGKIRNFSEGPWSASGTDLTEGSGKLWSFAMPSEGYINNTYHSVSNLPAYPSANLSATYSQYLYSIQSTGTNYYQNTGSDILSLGYTGSPNLVWNPAIPMGLPHYLGKTWQGTHSWQYGSYTVSGSVISEGQLNTPLGSYSALCVRYYYQNSYSNYNCYQWETREYGIMAYAIDLNGGMLYVLNQADQNVAISDPELIPSVPEFSFGPNPFNSEFKISFKDASSSPAEICIFNLKGQLLRKWQNFRATELVWDGRDSSSTQVSKGVYLLRISRDGNIRTVRILKD